MKLNTTQYKIIGESKKIYLDLPTVKIREKLNIAFKMPVADSDTTGIYGKYLKKEDLFINRMIEDIEVFSCFYDAIIISDVRLKKEINDLRKVFPELICVHVNRPNFDNGLTPEQKNHKTEIDLDDFTDFDVEVENTTLELLEESANNLYKEKEG